MSRGRPVTVGLLAVAALAACQAGEPSATPTTFRTPTSGTAATSGTSTPPSSPASSSPNGNPTALASVPAAARQHTAAGAEAFAKFYLGQVNKAWMKPDPDLIRPLALPTCKTCANFVMTAESLQQDSLRYDQPPGRVGASAVLPESNSNTVSIQLVNNQQASHVIRADGSIQETVTAQPGISQVEVRWQPKGWLVSSVKVVNV